MIQVSRMECKLSHSKFKYRIWRCFSLWLFSKASKRAVSVFPKVNMHIWSSSVIPLNKIIRSIP